MCFPAMPIEQEKTRGDHGRPPALTGGLSQVRKPPVTDAQWLWGAGPGHGRWGISGSALSTENDQDGVKPIWSWKWRHDTYRGPGCTKWTVVQRNKCHGDMLVITGAKPLRWLSSASSSSGTETSWPDSTFYRSPPVSCQLCTRPTAPEEASFTVFCDSFFSHFPGLFLRVGGVRTGALPGGGRVLPVIGS